MKKNVFIFLICLFLCACKNNVENRSKSKSDFLIRQYDVEIGAEGPAVCSVGMRDNNHIVDAVYFTCLWEHDLFFSIGSKVFDVEEIIYNISDGKKDFVSEKKLKLPRKRNDSNSEYDCYYLIIDSLNSKSAFSSNTDEGL